MKKKILVGILTLVFVIGLVAPVSAMAEKECGEVTIHFTEEYGNLIGKPIILKQEVGTTYYYEPKVLPTRSFISRAKDLTVTIDRPGQQVALNVEYSSENAKTFTIVSKFVDENGKEIQFKTTTIGDIGSDRIVHQEIVPKYTLDESNTKKLVSGVGKTEDDIVELVHVYQSRPEVYPPVEELPPKVNLEPYFVPFGDYTIRHNFVDMLKQEDYNFILIELESMNLINGIKSNKGQIEFRPNNKVTRGEFYTVVAKMFGAVEKGQLRYFDTLENISEASNRTHWYSPYQEALENVGAIKKGLTHSQMTSLISQDEAEDLMARMLVPFSAINPDTVGEPDEVPSETVGITRMDMLTYIQRVFEILRA